MSHFVVLVVGTPEQVDDMMFPYWELDYGNPSEYKEDPRSAFQVHTPKDKITEDAHEWASKYASERVKENMREYFALYDAENYPELIRRWEGGHINENGDIGRYRNPNAKWDWYVIGGRWKNFLLLKNKKKADFARVGDIDFESMKQEDVPYLTRFWEINVEGLPATEDEKNQYFSMYNKSFYLERYKTKENYVRLSSEFSTWAIITADGKWHEKGEMGWFGIGGETHEEAAKWAESFYDAFIKPLSPDTVITVVDCHI